MGSFSVSLPLMEVKDFFFCNGKDIYKSQNRKTDLDFKEYLNKDWYLSKSKCNEDFTGIRQSPLDRNSFFSWLMLDSVAKAWLTVPHTALIHAKYLLCASAWYGHVKTLAVWVLMNMWLIMENSRCIHVSTTSKKTGIMCLHCYGDVYVLWISHCHCE